MYPNIFMRLDLAPFRRQFDESTPTSTIVNKVHEHLEASNLAHPCAVEVVLTSPTDYALQITFHHEDLDDVIEAIEELEGEYCTRFLEPIPEFKTIFEVMEAVSQAIADGENDKIEEIRGAACSLKLDPAEQNTLDDLLGVIWERM